MLVSRILREPYSHCNAVLQGWSFVPAPEDVNFANWVDARAQMAWTPKRPRPTPMDRPWVKSSSEFRPVRRVDPEAKARLRERLGLKM